MKVSLTDKWVDMTGTMSGINNMFRDSRFNFRIEVIGHRTFKIYDVKLRTNKPYCGNHPGGCEVGAASRKGRFLEGADWVEFNDKLNNALDNMEVSANVSSSIVVVRQGFNRCIEYYQKQKENGRTGQWEKLGKYMNYCGKHAPASTFPEGTPGIYESIGYSVNGGRNRDERKPIELLSIQPDGFHGADIGSNKRNIAR